jgi:hypothetical protein
MTDDTRSEADEVAALEAVVRAVYEQNRSASPAWLATAAMQSIGFRREIHPIGYRGAHRTFEHIARAVAAGKDHDQIVQALTAEIAADTHDDDTLQARARADALDRHADLLESSSGTVGDETDSPRQ